MKGYMAAHSVVDGAIDEEREFTRQEDLMDWVLELGFFAAESGSEVLVFTLFHPHNPGIDCACIQYATDLRPQWSFNVEQDAEV